MEWIELDKVFMFIRNGKSIKQFGEDGYPITRIETIANRCVNENKVGYADIRELEKYKDYLLIKGDILMSHINSVKHLAKTAIFDSEIKLIHGMNLLCLRPDRNKVIPYYAFYCLNSDIFLKQIPNITKNSVNQASFNINSFKKLKIPVPSLGTQKQIVEVLDKSQNLIDCRKKQIELLDSLIESIFYDMFGDPVKNEKGWEVKKLENIIETLTDYHANGSYKILRENVELKNEKSYALMIRTTDLENDNFEGDVKYIDESAYNFLKKSKVYGGDIIINKIGSAGEVYIMPELNRKVSLGMNQFLMRTNESVKHIYLYVLFNSKNGKPLIKRKAKGAVTKTINKNAINSIEIPVPPLPLQNQFAQKVQAIEQQKQLLEKSLKLLENNYNNLMQRAFKGELF